MRFSIPLLITAGCLCISGFSNAQDSLTPTPPVRPEGVRTESVEGETDTLIFPPSDTILKNAARNDSLYMITADSLKPAVDSLTGADSLLQIQADSLAADSFKLDVPVSKDALDAEVAYTASDSIIYDVLEKKVHLYGNATANYKAINLKADYIQYDWVTGTLSAEMNEDSAGNITGYADFSDGAGSYRAKRLAYNFKTTKGKVHQVLTQEGEGYVHSEQVKREPNNDWYAYKGKYTTCNLDHPHFYFRANRMKVVPNKIIAAGPTNIVVADVPLPVYLPFALFPIRKGQRSGILLPEWGEERNRGFFLRNGGYYFGVSDYFDLALRADIYTSGSWAVKVNTIYKKRYKYNGNVRVDFAQNKLGEPESPDFSTSNDFRVNWSHVQDAKTALNSRFSANVNFASTTYDKNFSYDRERVLNNALASKMSYSKSWAGTPLSLSVNLFQDQNLNTGAINLQLPVLSFGVSRIQPFQSRKGVREKKWYDGIGFSYAFDAQNHISAGDSVFLTKETFKNARYGIRHSIPVSSSFKVFRHFTLTPRFNYTERWYFQTISKRWVGVDGTDTVNTLVTDTLTGFKPARDFSTGVSLTTRLFGQVNFRGKVKVIRHVFTPTLNVNYVPDFSNDRWGYYKRVQSDAQGETELYSIFQNGIYGTPPSGLIGSIGLSLNNVLEMKVFSKKDTVKHEKKIKLLESFTISGNYNLAADSLNLSLINLSGRTTLAGSKLTLDFGFTLDPYQADSLNRRIHRYVFTDDRHFTRLTSANLRLTTRFQSGQAASAAPAQPPKFSTPEETEMVEQYRDLYYDFSVPWSFGISYFFALRKGEVGDPDIINISSNSIDFNFDANLTPKWKVALQTGYDLQLRDLVFTTFSVVRDLHCWVLSFDWVPYPIEYQRYSMQINVKSSVLQDLKLTKRKERFDSVF